jgi:hypothetical protein
MDQASGHREPNQCCQEPGQRDAGTQEPLSEHGREQRQEQRETDPAQGDARLEPIVVQVAEGILMGSALVRKKSQTRVCQNAGNQYPWRKHLPARAAPQACRNQTQRVVCSQWSEVRDKKPVVRSPKPLTAGGTDGRRYLCADTPAKTSIPLTRPAATLSHRMGEGLGVRAAGSDICVYLRNLRSTSENQTVDCSQQIRLGEA